MRFSLSFKFLYKNRRYVKYRYQQPLDYHWRRAAVATALLLLAPPALAAAYIPLNNNRSSSQWGRTSSGSSPIAIPIIVKSSSAAGVGSAGFSTGSPALTQLADINSKLAHQNIITTYFYVGEPADQSNDYIANMASAWDGQWQQDYGGVDSPSPRSGYFPAGFTPKENPFYIALPYDDLTDQGARKTTAGDCPDSGDKSLADYSWCKNSWLKIMHGSKTVYAQWEDVGPFEENDTAYVFGSAAPANQNGAHAGLDVSPAVRDYLGLQDVDKCSWQFTTANNVPSGPWYEIITSSKGYKVSS